MTVQQELFFRSINSTAAFCSQTSTYHQ